MDSENSDDMEDHMGAVRSKKTSYICFKPLMYYNRHLDRYYYTPGKKKKKRIPKRSPLKRRKKIWTQKILMIWKTIWVL